MNVQIAQFPIYNGPDAVLFVAAVLNDNGTATIAALPFFSIVCILNDGTTRPAAVGDVLSMEPHGYWQARPAGTAGPAEVAARHPSLPLLQFNYLVPQSVVYKLA